MNDRHRTSQDRDSATGSTAVAGDGLRSLSSFKSLSPSPSLASSETADGRLNRVRSSHFDLMFESSGQLITFEMPKLPIPGDRVPLVRLKDHRLEYLDFEGPLEPGPQNENRGHVTRWTAGDYRILRSTKDKLIVDLCSMKLLARIALLPSPKDVGAVETRSSFWPGVIRWELRAPRWDVK